MLRLASILSSWWFTEVLVAFPFGRSAHFVRFCGERINDDVFLDGFQQTATTLYLHSHIASSGVVELRGVRLKELVSRMAKHSDFSNRAISC